MHAARHDSDGFLAGELERREALALSAVLAPDPDRLRRREPDPRARRGGALRVAAILAAGRDASVLGPAALFRLRGRERQVLVVKARRAPSRAVRGGRERPCGAWRPARAHAGVSFSVDVDPQ